MLAVLGQLLGSARGLGLVPVLGRGLPGLALTGLASGRGQLVSPLQGPVVVGLTRARGLVLEPLRGGLGLGQQVPALEQWGRELLAWGLLGPGQLVLALEQGAWQLVSALGPGQGLGL